MEGVVLNMDVVDYGAISKSRSLHTDSLSPRSEPDDGYSATGKGCSNFTTSESDFDPG